LKWILMYTKPVCTMSELKKSTEVVGLGIPYVGCELVGAAAV
jgi:hypothetical protein